MKCKALKDGLINKTDYVRVGEVFEAKKCPSWAVAIPAAKKEKEAEKSTQKDGE